MMKPKSQEFTPQSTSKELLVYLRVFPQMPIDNFTFKAKLCENGKEKEVYTYEPTENPPSNSEFKQLEKTFSITLKFEVKQYLQIIVLERESKKLYGKVQNLTVAQLFGSRRQGVRKTLKSGEHQLGLIFVYFEDQEGENQKIKLHVTTNDIQMNKKFLCCWPDTYYFTIARKILNQDTVVYTSQYHARPASDAFPSVQIFTRKLCNNKPNQDLTINFYNSSNHTLIGKADFSLTLLERLSSFHLQDSKRVPKGRVDIKHERRERQYEFTQFLQSGMQMALVAGIDFTASNESYQNKDSLHYFDGIKKSSYEIALQEVGGILLEYDYDKKVPVYGFGARVNYKGINSGSHTLHCFPISGNEKQHDIVGLDGILKAYRDCVPKLTFSGPTLFSPIISQAMEVCRQMKEEGRQYMILLLMTDGDINDYDNVVNLIVQCGRLPISIVIIGITNDVKEEWPLMKKLDDNNLQLTDSVGRKSERDLVKFVQYKKFINIPGQLSQEVLSQLPKQVEEYHKLEGMVPEDYLHHLPKAPENDLLVAQVKNEQEKVELLNSECMVIGASFNKKKAKNPQKKENQEIKSQKRLLDIKQKQDEENVDESMIKLDINQMMVSKPREKNSYAAKNYTPKE